MVNAINDSPKATQDIAATAYRTLLDRIDVLSNDTDPEDDPLRVVWAESAEGEVKLNADGTLGFMPMAGFSGVATILYKILDRPADDPEALKDFGKVLVTVSPPDDPEPPLPPLGEGDGIITGSDAGEVIDTGYRGDPDGDLVDAGDAVLPGQAPDDDIIRAGGGDDVILAGAGDDHVSGEEGNDRIDSGTGSDSVFGGSGDDRIDTGGPALAPDLGYPSDPGDALGYAPDAAPADDRDYVDAGAGDDLVRTGDDRDTVLGGAGQDSIFAGIDDDLVLGGQGADLLVGGEGRDTLLGGAGNDRIFAGEAPFGGSDLLNIPDASGADHPFAPDRNTENGRDYVDGGAGNDEIFGGDDDDTLIGGTGDDLIDGQTDDDLIRGDAGDDTLLGGEGADTLIGGADRDVFAALTAGDVVDGGSDGVDFDTLDLRDVWATGLRTRVFYTSEDRESGIVRFLDGDGEETGMLTFSEIESVVQCFTPGTRIATPRGERLVETLERDDLVITRDNGMQPIRWIGRRRLSGAELETAPHLRPVRIRAGALGGGLPLRDMLVSPNHRLLMASDRTALYFEEREVLVAAQHLTDLPGVETVAVTGTTYLHLLFDHHEVILSDGSWTESFQPGDMALRGADDPQRREIFELFPELATPEGVACYGAARRSLKRFEARLLVS